LVASLDASVITIDTGLTGATITVPQNLVGRTATLTARNGTDSTSVSITKADNFFVGPLPGTGGGLRNVTGATLTIGNETWTGLAPGKVTRPSQQEAAAMRNGGGGTADPQPGPPPSSFEFSPTIFNPNLFPGAVPLVFNQSIQLGSSTINLGQPLSFSGRVDFATTGDPDLFTAQFSAFDFQYSPFAVPQLGLTGLTREVLDTS